jgi:hypothetical protein
VSDEQTVTEFADPISTMVRYSTDTLTEEEKEIEHFGIPQTLRQLIEARVALDDPLVALVLPPGDLVSFAFWSEEPAFMESATALLRGHANYDKIIKDGFWNRVITWIDDFNKESEFPSTPGQRLAIAEIHAPHVTGCGGTFATTKSGALDVSIKAFGLGYQKIKRVTVSNSFEQPNACGSLTTGVQFVVHVWKHRWNDKRRALVQVISIDGTLAGEQLTGAHRCGGTYKKVALQTHSIARLRGWKVGEDFSDVPMHNAAEGAVTTHKMTLEKGSVYTASLELPVTWFAQPGVDASKLPKLAVSIESRVAKTVEMSWKLVSGHDYMRFRAEAGDMRMFWVWD